MFVDVGGLFAGGSRPFGSCITEPHQVIFIESWMRRIRLFGSLGWGEHCRGMRCVTGRRIVDDMVEPVFLGKRRPKGHFITRR